MRPVVLPHPVMSAMQVISCMCWVKHNKNKISRSLVHLQLQHTPLISMAHQPMDNQLTRSSGAPRVHFCLEAKVAIPRSCCSVSQFTVISDLVVLELPSWLTHSSFNSCQCCRLVVPTLTGVHSCQSLPVLLALLGIQSFSGGINSLL